MAHLQTLPNDLISSLAARRILHVHRRTFERYVRLGKLRSWKLPGGHHRVSEREVRALLEPRDRGQQPLPPTRRELDAEDERVTAELRKRGYRI